MLALGTVTFQLRQDGVRRILQRDLQCVGSGHKNGECRGHDQGRQGEMDGQKSSLGLRVGERGDGQRDLKIGQALKINRGVRSGRINNSPGSKQSRGTKWFPGSVGSGPGG